MRGWCLEASRSHCPSWKKGGAAAAHIVQVPSSEPFTTWAAWARDAATATAVAAQNVASAVKKGHVVRRTILPSNQSSGIRDCAQITAH